MQLDAHQNVNQLQLTDIALKITLLSLKRGSVFIYIREGIPSSPGGSLTSYELVALSSTAQVHLKYNTL